MRTKEMRRQQLVHGAILHRPDPDHCLSQEDIVFLSKNRNTIPKNELCRYDEGMKHLAECRACAQAYKKHQLNSPSYLLNLTKDAVRRTDFQKALEEVNLEITFVQNNKTGKQELHVDYISPSYLMGFEHEEFHRNILAKLLNQGLISAHDLENVIITRHEGATEPSPRAEPALKKKKQDNASK